jgi:hypothetical protein
VVVRCDHQAHPAVWLPPAELAARTCRLGHCSQQLAALALGLGFVRLSSIELEGNGRSRTSFTLTEATAVDFPCFYV